VPDRNSPPVHRYFVFCEAPKAIKISGISGQSAKRACPVHMEAIVVVPLCTAPRLPKLAVVIKVTLDILGKQ
jgi:hypothetical protein